LERDEPFFGAETREGSEKSFHQSEIEPTFRLILKFEQNSEKAEREKVK